MTHLRIPAARCARVLPFRLLPLRREGAGKTGRWLRPQHRVQWVVKNAHGFDRYSRDIPAFPAQWFDGLYVLSPGSGLSCPRCCMGLTSSVAPGSRRQDHTISPYAAAFRLAGDRLTPQRPSQPAPTLRDDAHRPLWRHGLRRKILLIYGNVKRDF